MTSTKTPLSKAALQDLVSSNGTSISFVKPAHGRSEFWKSYSQIYVEGVAQDYIICLQCKTVLKWTSENGTRVMSHHSCVKQASTSTECPLIRKRITEACVEFCAVDGRSFESVAGTGFINLAKQLISAGAILGTSINVNELLPNPSTISRNVEPFYLNLKQQLISLCGLINHYCITLSLHYIDSQEQLRLFTLSCQAFDYETQHAVNIRSFVDKVLHEFNLCLKDNVFVVTDNENKMKSAFKDNVKRIGCSAHYVNKILQHAFTYDYIQCDDAQSLFKTVRSIVTKVRQCHRQSTLTSYLQNYSDTRFSGIYIMLDSFLKVYFELATILNDEQKMNYLRIDRDDLESLCLYLKKFCDVIEKLSCEKSPTLHLVIPYKQALINWSYVTDDDNLSILPVKRYIGKELEDYWVVADVHYIATMLHPNLKSFNHTPHKKCHAEALLKLEFDKYQQLEQQRSSSNNNNNINYNRRTQVQQRNKTQLSASLDDIFDLPTSADELHDDKDSKTEYDRYIEDKKKIDKDMNVLVYWNDNKLVYPTLATIAQRVLCIPSTNTSVERLFSDSGNTITSLRTRLQTSKVNQLLFVRRNLSTLREIFPPTIEQLRKRTNSSTCRTGMKKLKTSKEEDDSITVLEDSLHDRTFDDDHDDDDKENDGCNDV
ncbi:unnamed protein product [Rotaria sp. Silwood2]|nr:unnamed protein product [Rotaria sp. Silwood2]